MAEAITMKAGRRDKVGSQHARQLRKKGLVPAILYGHKQENVPLSVSAEDFQKALRRGARILDLEAGGAPEKVLIREVQWDHLGIEILHVDLERVSAEERIAIEIPVEPKGIAPGTSGGGVLEQVIHSLRVECPALAVPDALRVNIGSLQLGQSILVKDLVLPEGVKALVNADEVVFHVVSADRGVEPEAAGLPAAESAEPELIKKPKEDKGEGE